MIWRKRKKESWHLIFLVKDVEEVESIESKEFLYQYIYQKSKKKKKSS